jgi:hypothetical protein
MKREIQYNIPPGIDCVDRVDDINEANNRLQSFGWVLLGILYTRDVQGDGSFKDKETYILGLNRAGAPRT